MTAPTDSTLFVYTCVVGDYDWILPPVYTSCNVKYFCFTDSVSSLKSACGWSLLDIPNECSDLSPTLINRYCKFFPHKILPTHVWSIYIDANVRILHDPLLLINQVTSNQASLGLFLHRERQSVSEEALDLVSTKKVASEEQLNLLRNQIKSYYDCGFHDQFPLTENNIIFRRSYCPSVVSLMNDWWTYLLSGVHRDQLSLPFLLWRSTFPVHYFSFYPRMRNQFFSVVPHKKLGFANYITCRQYHGFAWRLLYLAMVFLKSLIVLIRKPFN